VAQHDATELPFPTPGEGDQPVRGACQPGVLNDRHTPLLAFQITAAHQYTVAKLLEPCG
jgi:hypothetical protein